MKRISQCYTSPKGGSRGCLCPDNTYNVKCCDGSIQAQGIGNITGIKITNFILLENLNRLLQENNDKLIKENG